LLNDRRGANAERRDGCDEKKKLWRAKPHERPGMKQGRTAGKGGNRQEGEKPWRRNGAGQVKPGEQWTFPASCAEGDRNLMGGTATLQHTLRSAAGGQALKGA
jgi:hypothetical protein